MNLVNMLEVRERLMQYKIFLSNNPLFSKTAKMVRRAAGQEGW